MNTFQLPPTQVLREPSTVDPIGLNPLSWSSGNHRRSGDQAWIGLRHQLIIQSVARWSSLVSKGNLLIGKMLAHVVNQMLRLIRHGQRSNKALVITKSHRDLILAHIQSDKHIVVLWYKRLASHQSASSVRWRFRHCTSNGGLGVRRHPSYKSHHERETSVMSLSLWLVPAMNTGRLSDGE